MAFARTVTPAVRIVARNVWGPEVEVRLTDGTLVTEGHVMAAGYLSKRKGLKSLVVTAINVGGDTAIWIPDYL